MEAVLFDMDGVVVLNNHIHKMAWLKTLEDHGVIASEEEFSEYISGRTGQNIIEHFLGSKNNYKKIIDGKETLYRELAKDLISLVPGWLSFCNWIRGQGLKTALVTSAPPVNVKFVFDTFNIDNSFNAIVDGDNVTHGKPNPDCYNLACRKLNINPSGAVVIEDSFSGIESAKSSGCYCIALTTTHKREEIAIADKVVDNYQEIRSELMSIALESNI